MKEPIASTIEVGVGSSVSFVPCLIIIGNNAHVSTVAAGTMLRTKDAWKVVNQCLQSLLTFAALMPDYSLAFDPGSLLRLGQTRGPK